MLHLHRKSSSSSNKSIIFAAVAIFVILIWSWHFLAPTQYTSRKTSYSLIPSFSMSGLHGHVKPRYWSSNINGLEGIRSWKRPIGLKKIVGLVFYGRAATVSILDCYLRRNLVKNGGMLDEVVFIMRTKNVQDIGWLNVIMKDEPAYSQWNVTYDDYGDYKAAYNRIQNGTMYIKMDDDIVFIEDTAIPSIVEKKWNHPEHFVVSANVMNQPALSWVHWRLGAILPYLPEMEPPPPPPKVPEDLRIDWRASKLPDWKGDEDFTMTLDYRTMYKKHRWLPVKYETSNRTIDDTPIVMGAKFDAFGPSLDKWPIGAQEHYSFFENLENNELWRYKFGQWDFNYTRMGIQFIALMGDDINMGKPIEQKDDEYFFSEVMTKRTSRHGVVDGRSVVAHYSFLPQKKGIDSTDILDRYRSFAKENICLGQ